MNKSEGNRTGAGLLEEALAHHQAGRLDQAEEIYQRILRVNPAEADALHYAGLAAHQRGRTAEAIESMRRAIASDATKPHFYENLGAVLESAGEQEEALACYRRLAELDPVQAGARLKAANCLLRLGRSAESAVSCSAALALRPEYPEAMNSMGLALMGMGRLEQAIVCFRKALALKPDYADAYVNLGLPLRELSRIEESIACSCEAIRLDPRSYSAFTNLSVTLSALDKLEEAAQCCEQAMAIDPHRPEAYLNMGNALRELGYLERAVGYYRRAIELDAGNAGAYSNLGDTLRDMGRIAEAAASYQQALAVRPAFRTAFSNLLYLHSFARDISPEQELALAAQWEQSALSAEERAAARHRARPSAGVFSTAPRTGRRLHLGVVSAELGAHAVAEFLQPFLENVGKQRFRLTLFPTTVRSGVRAEALRGQADEVVSLVGMGAAEAAERIRATAVDVLIDTSGHTCDNRLDIFAHRAAPVQLSYIGYWSTTGLTEMDWVLAHPFAPREFEGHFSERPWMLPRLAVCYRGDPSLPESGWRPGETIWLGSFNKYSKMREETLALWGKTLQALPEAKLLLEDRARHEEESRARILAGLAAYGVGAERVEFVAAIADHAQHMMLYDRIDIALDTVPFNSGTTAYDALWMGAPLVALQGAHAGGFISSIALHDLGRDEWIAHSEEEFVEIVCSLARNVELRRELRRTQRARMAASPICDHKALTEDIQTAFEQMYDSWLQSESR